MAPIKGKGKMDALFARSNFEYNVELKGALWHVHVSHYGDVK